mmetsp:Transcript_108453/g.335005  ORF Transcript_108453/g.335005 Transcript_108453/m.335005 type:complete len:496 (-) Transcript_108453:134-1621(-)
MSRPDVQSYTLLEPQSEMGRTDVSGEALSGANGTEETASGTPPSSSTWQVATCVENDQFQFIMGLVIFSNIAVLWGETDVPELAVWAVFDNLFLVIFLVEIVLRLLHHGPLSYYCGKDKWWAYLDTAIVALGIFDLWITPLFIGKTTADSCALRFLRLMRLLRLLRIFRMFHKLQSFVSALWNMFGTFIWIFSVLFLFIFCFAIMLTHLLGHAEALGDPEQLALEENAETVNSIIKNFKDVPTSLFTLFQLTTTDNWDCIAMPLVEINPWWRLFFVFFISFASWTMISVLTAVASESMVAATTDRKEQEMREAEQQAKAFIEFLRDAFKKADTDGNGLLDKEEFETMMKKEFVVEQMRNMGFTMTEEEILKAWDMLDIHRKGELTIDSFVSGLSYLQEKLSARHVMNVSYLLKRVSRRLDASIQNLLKELDGLSDQNNAIVHCIHSQEQLRDQQEMTIWLWYQWMRRHDPKAVKGANPVRPAKLQETAAGTAHGF